MPDCGPYPTPREIFESVPTLLQDSDPNESRLFYDWWNDGREPKENRVGVRKTKRKAHLEQIHAKEDEIFDDIDSGKTAVGFGGMQE